MNSKVQDIMTPDPVGVYFDQTIADTARIMRDAQVGAVWSSTASRWPAW